MPDRIRFHLDEHVDPDIARALRRYGIDVTTRIFSVSSVKHPIMQASPMEHALLVRWAR